MEEFESRLARLDPGLFGHVLSQSTDNDKRAFLALQSAARQLFPRFIYLEIGSYRGGSLQPYLLDPRCERIVSIDPRPFSLPDERGESLSYWQNSTQAMLDGLAKIPGADLGRLKTVDQGTDTLKPESLGCRPHLCFIDGEHTDEAVLRDSRFCLAAVERNGCLAYHDANIVYGGILAFIEELRRTGRPFRAVHLADSVVFIELDDCRFSETEPARTLQRNNCDGYLWSLRENDHYRRYYNLPLLRAFRAGKAKTWDRFAGRLRKTFGAAPAT
jgi:hypothetical protein